MPGAVNSAVRISTLIFPALICALAACAPGGHSVSPTTVTVRDTVTAQSTPTAGAVATPTRPPIPPPPATTISGDGIYRVGIDIRPGTYRTRGSESCYWERLSGFSGEADNRITNGLLAGPQVVQILSSDAGFMTQDCATWTLISPVPVTSQIPVPAATLPGGDLPDADSQGFTTYQGAARCHGTDQAVQVVRTAKSAVVVCKTNLNALYYRGLRLSDNALIELAGARQTESGFAVSNTDGTLYEISSTGLVIRTAGDVYTEQAVESAP
jgi:hypothetical protein